MTIRPTRRTFFGGLSALLFAGFVGKKLTVAAAPLPPTTPQPLPTKCAWNHFGSLPHPAGCVTLTYFTYPGGSLTTVEGPGNTRTWIYDGTRRETR
jgi:hypothetical protein